VVLFSGSLALCKEFSLVLLARLVEHEIVPDGAYWALLVPGHELRRAHEELGRYSLERQVRRPVSKYRRPAPGAIYGAAAYTVSLLFIAYCAGIRLFNSDWLTLGGLDSAEVVHHQWWRAVTALTLHTGPGHLLSNLAYGLLAGIAAARLIGPGVAWAAGLSAAVLANVIEMAVSPVWHRAIGASTLVFALLGLITGLAVADTEKSRERSFRRWTPVAAGVALLALTGGGGVDLEKGAPQTDVDILGHLLGFACGVGTGFLMQKAHLRSESARVQILAGAAALATIAVAWALALLVR
jgi:membrane associated rhomboid family serine protease